MNCEHTARVTRVGVIFGYVVVLLLFAAIVVVSLTLAGWPR